MSSSLEHVVGSRQVVGMQLDGRVLMLICGAIWMQVRIYLKRDLIEAIDFLRIHIASAPALVHDCAIRMTTEPLLAEVRTG
jgi:hypothetical protein